MLEPAATPNPNAPVTSVVDGLQKRQRTYRLEQAQEAMNWIDEFRKSASAQAARDGASPEQVAEAAEWGRNGGLAVGYAPLAGLVEIGVASRMAAFTTGIGARGILGSPLLRHFVGGAAANMSILDPETPLLPQSVEDASTRQQLNDLFLTPNYVGAGLVGGAMGAAGAYLMPKIFDGFGFKRGYQGNRNLPTIYDDTRGFHKQQAPDPLRNADIPEADWSYVENAGMHGDGGAVPVDVLSAPVQGPGIGPFGALPDSPLAPRGPFFMDTPASVPQPIAGLLDGPPVPRGLLAAGEPVPGVSGDLTQPFPSATTDVTVNSAVDVSANEAVVDVFRDRAVDSWVDVGVDAVWVPPKPRASRAVMKVRGVRGPSLFPPQPETQLVQTQQDFGGLPAFDMDFGYTGLVNAGLVPFVSGGGMIDPATLPQTNDLQFDFGFPVGLQPQTNAPVLTPSADGIPSVAPTAVVPLADQSPDVFAPTAIESSVPDQLDLNQPITTQERLVDAGLEPESAMLIEIDEVATVPEQRMRMPDQVFTGRDIAEAMGSVYRGADGLPMLAYGVGNYQQAYKYSDNGMQELYGGRGLTYLTTNAENAAGVVDQQYMQQEIAGQLYPAPTTEMQATPNVTNAARQAVIMTEQTQQKINGMKRELARMPVEGALADQLRQQINAAEQLLAKQQIPSSAITPFYISSRRHLDMNAPLRPGIGVEMLPSERSAAEDIVVATLEQMGRMYPQTAARIVKIAEQLNGGKRYNVEGGVQKLYNDLTYKAANQADNFKGGMVNRALQSVGVDSMHYTVREGVSFGNSQIGSIGSDVVMVLDPRALIPAYGVDDVVMRNVADLHAVQMSKAVAVVTDPARPDLPEIKRIGDIDYVDSKIIVQQNEHVMVRNPENAADLMLQARKQYPGLYVQVVDAPNGRTSVYVGAKPMTPRQQESYRETGYYAHQMVKDASNGGRERFIRKVEPNEKTGEWGIWFDPLPNKTGLVGPIKLTPANKMRYVPGTSAAPTIEFGGRELWQEFTGFASAYLGVLNSEGKAAVSTLLDADARKMLPSILADWFDSKGMVNVLERKAVTAIFDQELTKLYQGTAPEHMGFYEAMRDSYMEYTDGQQVPPSLHELASMRGMTMTHVRGGPGIILRSGTTAETLHLENQPAARTFLENLEPVENIIEPNEIPMDIAPYPAHENVPMGTAGNAEELVVVGNEENINRILDDELPLTRDMAEETGEGMVGPEHEPIFVQGASASYGGAGTGNQGPTFGGGSQVPPNLGSLSAIAELGQITLNKGLGWFQPNHSMFAKMEQLLYNIVDKNGVRPFSMLRPYEDTQILKRQQAIALERGNPAYKALERTRRKANYRALVDGDTFRVLAIKDPAQRMNYVTSNQLPMDVLETVDQLDHALDLIFETPAQRAAHADNLITYIEEVGRQQALNRTAPHPYVENIYDDAAQGLSNIGWFVEHAKRNRMMAETVNAVDILNAITHSYNHARFVAAQAKVVEDHWNKIGSLKILLRNGELAYPLEPFAKEVHRWLDILRTGQDRSMDDPAASLVSKMFTKMGMPFTVGESRKFLAQMTGNLSKSYLGWVLSPVLRDFPQLLYTTAATGVGPVAQAMRDFITPGVRDAAFVELRRLGLASTENELQNSSPIIHGDIGDGEVFSTFTPDQIRRRQMLENAYVTFTNAVPSMIREAGNIGMTAYLKSNSLSRAVTARASLLHWRSEIAKRGFDRMSPAGLVNVMVNNPEVFEDLFDDLGVTLEPTSRMIRDLLTQGKAEEAMVEYGQHIMALTQGMYGPLHTGKLWRTQTGRMGGMFQNYSMFQIDMAAQMGGRATAARKMNPVKRAWYITKFLAVAGGIGYAYKELKERTGFDMTGWAYWNTALSKLPLFGGVITDAVVTSGRQINAVLSQTGDRPQSYIPGGTGVPGMLGNAAFPLARPIGRYVDLFGNAMNSENPQNEILNFILSGKSAVNGVDLTRQANEGLSDSERFLREAQQQGNGAQ
jgi:hypothetical protein